MVTRSSLLLGAFVLSLPITVRMGSDSVPPDSATRDLVGAMRTHETRFTAATGASSFGIVEHGCDNEFLRSQEFRQREVGGDLEQHVSGPLSVGVRAGTIHERVTTTESVSGTTPPGGSNVVTRSTRDNAYVNPYLRLTRPSFEISAGGMVSREPFLNGRAPAIRNPVTLGLRIGRLDRAAFRASWMEGVPLVSGNDELSIGAEVWAARNLSVFVGGAFGPDHGATLLRGQWWVAPPAALNFSGRIGPARGDIGTSGVSIGLTLRTPPHAAPASPAGMGGDPAGPAAPSTTPPDSSRRSP